MSAREHALRLAVLKVLAARVTAAVKEAEAAVSSDMAVGERLVPSVDDVPLAAVQIVKGRCTPSVSDPDKLAAWVAEHYPTEVETRLVVRPGFIEKIKAHSAKAGEPCVDGVLDVPGVHVSVGAPHPSTKPTSEAAAVIEELWRAGRLALDGSFRELPGGAP